MRHQAPPAIWIPTRKANTPTSAHNKERADFPEGPTDSPSRHSRLYESDNTSRVDFQDGAVSALLQRRTSSVAVHPPVGSEHDDVLSSTDLTSSNNSGNMIARVFSSTRRRTNSSTWTQDAGSVSLQNQLFRALVLHNGNQNPGFIPNGRLQELITRDSVAKELVKSLRMRIKKTFPKLWRHLSPEELNDILDKIFGGHNTDSNCDTPRTYKKIMTILCLMGRAHEIRSFVKSKVCDDDLPLIVVPSTNNVIDNIIGNWDLRRKDEQKTPLRCFKRWRTHAVRSFDVFQWTVLSPSFSRGDRITVDDRSIMPFNRWELKRFGGLCPIYLAEIHPDHHRFDENDMTYTPSPPTTPSYKDHDAPGQTLHPNLFAVKELYRKDTKLNFRKEAGALKKVGRNSHPHLVSLLASYRYQGNFYFIFPWAQCDLSSFWKRHTDKHRNPGMDRWIITQCKGLADGLAAIHRLQTTTIDSIIRQSTDVKEFTRDNGEPAESRLQLSCRHGDIKPENILWFPINGAGPPWRGVLKIADFGSAELSTKREVAKESRTCSPMYQPPESFPEVSGTSVVRTSYDIWCMGCLYLEFIAWWFGGWPSIDRFLNKRLATDKQYFKIEIGKFFGIQQDDTTDPDTPPKAVVKEAVLNFIQELRENASCTPFFDKFLHLIQKRMLVIVDKNGGGRISARKTAEKLATLVPPALEGDAQVQTPGLEDVLEEQPVWET